MTTLVTSAIATITVSSAVKSQSVTIKRHIRNSGVTDCPTCGHPIPLDDIAAQLPPRQRAVYEVIRDAGVEGIGRMAVEQLVYGDEADGGAHSNSIPVMVCRWINPRLKARGLTIRSRKMKWRLTWIEE